MEASLLLRNKSNNSVYLRSLLNIPTRSVAVYPNIKNDSKDDAKAKYLVVKTRFNLPQKEFYHDFDANPVFEMKVEVQIDCTNLLHTTIDSLFVSALNANEKAHKTTKTITEPSFNRNTFGWAGKTKWKIEKDIQGEPLSKATDMSQYVQDLQRIPSILHWAIVDAKTCDIWVKSEHFEFATYTDEKIKTDDSQSNEINERECLPYYFKLFGNVKSYLGLRLMREKFVLKHKKDYDDERHFVKFTNEGRTLYGCAGRTDSCILVAIFEKPQMDLLKPEEPESLISQIYDRLYDRENHFHEKTFHDSHSVIFTAQMTSPGAFDLNHLQFHGPRNEPITSMNNVEEVNVVIRNRAAMELQEADLLG